MVTTAITATAFSELVDLIYAAGARRGDWDEVLAAMDHLVPDTSLVLQALDGRNGGISIPYIRNWDAAAATSYIEHYWRHSPWVGLHENAIIGQPYNTTAATPVERIRESAFFQDWARPHRVHCGATALTAIKTPNAVASLCINYDHRRIDDLDPFFDRLFGRLAPHLVNALELRYELEAANSRASTLASLLEGQRRPILLADGEARVIAANAAAEQLLRRGWDVGGDAIGRLRLGSAKVTEVFRDYCRKALDQLGYASQASLHLPFSLEGRPHVASARLVMAPRSGGHETLFFLPAAAVLVTLIDISVGFPIEEQVLAQVFKLTQAETRVAAELAAGKSPKEIAAAAGTAISTVRNQLRVLFWKTGTKGQTELALLLAKFRLFGESPPD